VRVTLALACAGAAALVVAAPAAAFTPSNSDYPKQWYLAQDHAFDAWQTPPQLAPVKVAVIDSGVDCNLPDFQGRIAEAQSFVGGSACTDSEGHGTIVAGEIAADLGSNGIVGIAYSAQLLVAKVVANDGTIPLSAESRAIRWAANQGARVINLSFGAVRDPQDPSIDTFSRVEAKAVAYAVKKGVLVVAAAGNSDEAPTTPWDYASWPAALPHVLGVGALTKTGNVPDFSDRDQTFLDVTAPGVATFSTFPAALAVPGCQQPGYTDCAPGDYSNPQGTSFAAPQVSAAAAVLFGVDPSLTNSQAETLIERSADDVNAASGCAECGNGRDRYAGWGRLDVANAVAAVAGALPAADRYEPNDTVTEAPTLGARRQVINASLDYWDDPVDYYRVRLSKGARLVAFTRAKWHNARVHLMLVSGAGLVRKGFATRPGPKQRFNFRAPKSAWYYVELKDSRRGGGAYVLKLQKSAA
jgi:hypothetical protein